jgi:peptide/nickel transport system permease protein
VFRYILRRILVTIPILLIVTVIVFSVMQLLPGDPARMVLGQEATPHALEVMRERLGLNRPLHEQYLVWLAGVVQGDLGRSLVDNTPVARAIALALPVTLQITVMALIIALMIGVPLGVVAATRQGGVWDGVATLVGLSSISMPGFWVAILLIYWLTLQFPVFPTIFGIPGFAYSLLDPRIRES